MTTSRTTSVPKGLHMEIQRLIQSKSQVLLRVGGHSSALCTLITEQVGQPFGVGDVLYFGYDNATGFLEDGFVCPRRIERSQSPSNAVMFSQGVHQRQKRLFRSPGVTGKEAAASSPRRHCCNRRSLEAVDGTQTFFGKVYKWLTNYFEKSIQKLQKYTKSIQKLVNHLYTLPKKSLCGPEESVDVSNWLNL